MIDRSSFFLANSGLMGTCKGVKKISDALMDENVNVYMYPKKYYADECIKTTSIDIQSHHWYGNRKISL